MGLTGAQCLLDPYVRLTVPSRAVHVEQIADPVVREAVELVQLETTFAAANAIDVDDLGVPLYAA